MKWLVYYHEWNGEEITALNIFDHGRFADDVKKALKKFDTREEFAEQLRRDLFYYFGSKCEYEVIIAPWIKTKNTKSIKVDIYQQVRLNWDVFVDYVWSHKPCTKGRAKSA